MTQCKIILFFNIPSRKWQRICLLDVLLPSQAKVKPPISSCLATSVMRSESSPPFNLEWAIHKLQVSSGCLCPFFQNHTRIFLPKNKLRWVMRSPVCISNYRSPANREVSTPSTINEPINKAVKNTNFRRKQLWLVHATQPGRSEAGSYTTC